jgi:hypothetical protein
VIGHAAHLLPTQGPIGVFIHHNTLHAFQHLPFEEAVVEAARKFGAEPFLTEARYQYEVRRGRIRIADIEAVLNDEADEPIWPRTLSRRELRRAIIWPGRRPFSPDNIEWLIEEKGVLERLRDDLAPTVTEAIRGGSLEEESQLAHNLSLGLLPTVGQKVKPQSLPPVRPAEGLKRLTGIDLDQIIHPLLIRLAAVYLDQGQSYWPMPRRPPRASMTQFEACMAGMGSTASCLRNDTFADSRRSSGIRACRA